MTIQDQIIKYEGFSPVAYKDSLGKLTIGFGRLIDIGGGITREEAMFLLQNDISRVQTALQQLSYFSSLSEPRQAVLVNMAFQLGINGLLNFKKTLNFIQASDYDSASKEMLNSTWAIQTPVRAKELSEQMRSGMWN